MCLEGPTFDMSKSQEVRSRVSAPSLRFRSPEAPQKRKPRVKLHPDSPPRVAPTPDSPGRYVRRFSGEYKRVIADRPFLAIRLENGLASGFPRDLNDGLTGGGPEVTD